MIVLILILNLVLIGVLIGGLSYAIYCLHLRVETITSKITLMTQWCETLRENENTIVKDFKKLYREFQAIEKNTDQ